MSPYTYKTSQVSSYMHAYMSAYSVSISVAWFVYLHTQDKIITYFGQLCIYHLRYLYVTGFAKTILISTRIEI